VCHIESIEFNEILFNSSVPQFKLGEGGISRSYRRKVPVELSVVRSAQPNVWRAILTSPVLWQVRQQHSTTVSVSSTQLFFTLGQFEGEALEKLVHQELFTAPPSRWVLVEALQSEVSAFRANVLRQLVIQRLDRPRVRDAESTKELIGFEDLHVAWDEVS